MWDALQPASHHDAVEAAFAGAGDVDLVLYAAGVLGDQGAFDTDPSAAAQAVAANFGGAVSDRKSTRLNSSHITTSYAVFRLKKKTMTCRILPVIRTTWALLAAEGRLLATEPQ